MLTINQEKIQEQELPHDLFLIIRQTNKIRNAFANNMSTDTKLSKAQISKIIKSGGSFGSWLGNLCKKSTSKYCYSFSKR